LRAYKGEEEEENDQDECRHDDDLIKPNMTDDEARIGKLMDIVLA
jgi:hypothetical protein